MNQPSLKICNHALSYTAPEVQNYGTQFQYPHAAYMVRQQVLNRYFIYSLHYLLKPGPKIIAFATIMTWPHCPMNIMTLAWQIILKALYKFTRIYVLICHISNDVVERLSVRT